MPGPSGTSAALRRVNGGLFCEKASSKNVPSCAGGNADSAFSVCSRPCRTVLTRNTRRTALWGERRTRPPPRPIRRVRSFLSAAGGWAARKPFPENTSTFPFRPGVIPPSARGIPSSARAVAVRLPRFLWKSRLFSRNAHAASAEYLPAASPAGGGFSAPRPGSAEWTVPPLLPGSGPAGGRLSKRPCSPKGRMAVIIHAFCQSAGYVTYRNRANSGAENWMRLPLGIRITSPGPAETVRPPQITESRPAII